MQSLTQSESAQWLDIKGAFKAEVLQNDRKFNLYVATNGEGLTYWKSTSRGELYRERVHGTAMSRDIDLINARYDFKLATKIESGSFNDTLEISTGKSLEGYLNTYPDAGFITFDSSRFLVRLTADGASPGKVAFSYDKQGDGHLDGAAGLTIDKWWYFGNNEFPFSNTLLWKINQTPFGLYGENIDSLRLLGVYSLDGSYDNSPRSVFNTSSLQVDSATPQLVYQFSRPINKDTLSTFALKYKPPQVGLAYQDIPVRTVVNGAQIRFQPLQPLQPGFYELGYEGREVYDITNSYSVDPGYSGFEVTQKSIAKASASTDIARIGRLVKLNALANNASGAASAYQWVQTAGPEVAIQDASSAKASFIVPTLNKPNELLVFKVVITMDNGRTQTSTVRVHAYQSEDVFELLDYVSEPNDSIGQGKSQQFLSFRLQSPSDKKVISAWFGNQLESGSLSLKPVGGLKPGFFENAIIYPANNYKNGLAFYTGGRGCNTVKGNFTIYEIVFDEYNRISKLAADFVQYCDGKAPALRGRIRYHTVTNM